MEGQENVQQNPVAQVRYVSLAEHQALQAQLVELVKHVNDIRFSGPTIELPENLQILSGLKVVEKAAE